MSARTWSALLPHFLKLLEKSKKLEVVSQIREELYRLGDEVPLLLFDIQQKGSPQAKKKLKRLARSRDARNKVLLH